MPRFGCASGWTFGHVLRDVCSDRSLWVRVGILCAMVRGGYGIMAPLSKGNLVKIPEPGRGHLRQRNRTRRRLREPRKEFSFLFNNDSTLESVHPEMGSCGWKSTSLVRCPVRFFGPLKIRGRDVRTPARTHIRIRSPRFIASSYSGKASKGSRQTRSVTSGQGLALRIGQGGSVSCSLGTGQELRDLLLWNLWSLAGSWMNKTERLGGFTCWVCSPCG